MKALQPTALLVNLALAYATAACLCGCNQTTDRQFSELRLHDRMLIEKMLDERNKMDAAALEQTKRIERLADAARQEHERADAWKCYALLWVEYAKAYREWVDYWCWQPVPIEPCLCGSPCACEHIAGGSCCCRASKDSRFLLIPNP